MACTVVNQVLGPTAEISKCCDMGSRNNVHTIISSLKGSDGSSHMSHSSTINSTKMNQMLHQHCNFPQQKFFHFNYSLLYECSRTLDEPQDSPQTPSLPLPFQQTQNIPLPNGSLDVPHDRTSRGSSGVGIHEFDSDLGDVPGVSRAS